MVRVKTRVQEPEQLCGSENGLSLSQVLGSGPETGRLVNWTQASKIPSWIHHRLDFQMDVFPNWTLAQRDVFFGRSCTSAESPLDGATGNLWQWFLTVHSLRRKWETSLLDSGLCSPRGLKHHEELSVSRTRTILNLWPSGGKNQHGTRVVVGPPSTVWTPEPWTGSQLCYRFTLQDRTNPCRYAVTDHLGALSWLTLEPRRVF